MSLESVRAFFHANAPDLHIIELATSTATVALAAEAHGVEPGQIAKTLAFRVGERNVLLVARGDARIDNKKIKDALGSKAKMLDAETVVALTSHPVGGVCPFGLPRSHQGRTAEGRRKAPEILRRSNTARIRFFLI